MSRDGSRIAETEESERSRHSDAGGLDHDFNSFLHEGDDLGAYRYRRL